jgi:hypothetical protein
MPDEDDDPLARFLAQAPEHGFDDNSTEWPPRPEVTPATWWTRLQQFLFEKKPGEYSSIAPRRSDGSRVGIFPFNGNGRSR